jgi:quinolinate synthase
LNYNIINSVKKLKKDKNAIILAHFYQLPEIQELADFVGDSYGLSIKAKEIKAKIILFAGVKFMAETAKILNPQTKILLPEPAAGCSLSDSCPPEEFSNFKKKYPDHLVVTYINSSIEIKTMSDIVCTSSNAVKIIQSLPSEQKIIFAPDKNLGRYIMEKTGKKMVLWDGSCHVHHQLHAENVISMKKKYPAAVVVAHPECQGTVLSLADFVGSTNKIVEYCFLSKQKEFIIATETGILHELKKKSPKKNFYIVSVDESCACNDCNFMKMITLEKILYALEKEKFEIEIEEKVRIKALRPIERMIELSEQ